jgi:hypothetical protein
MNQMLINVSTRVKTAKPRPIDFDLAAVEADLALRIPPAVPLGNDLAHGVDHRLLAQRDPSSRQGPSPRKPDKTTRSSPKYSTGPQASALSSDSKLVHGIALSDHKKPVPVAPRVGHVDGVVS